MTLNQALDWDYTELASTYDLRPDYAPNLVRQALSRIGCQAGDAALDVGAGTGKLTALLCDHGLDLTALEPNDRMREIALSKGLGQRARWLAGCGEALPVADQSCALVAFGSSFNVLPAQVALAECARVLRPGGHWLAIWNHRDLDDPLQKDVEGLIRGHLPDYDPGRRRRSPEPDLQAHGGWHALQAQEEHFVVDIPAEDWLAAWQSHATLSRQAGAKRPVILAELRRLVGTARSLRVPYFSHLWTAHR